MPVHALRLLHGNRRGKQLNCAALLCIVVSVMYLQSPLGRLFHGRARRSATLFTGNAWRHTQRITPAHTWMQGGYRRPHTHHTGRRPQHRGGHAAGHPARTPLLRHILDRRARWYGMASVCSRFAIPNSHAQTSTRQSRRRQVRRPCSRSLHLTLHRQRPRHAACVPSRAHRRFHNVNRSSVHFAALCTRSLAQQP